MNPTIEQLAVAFARAEYDFRLAYRACENAEKKANNTNSVEDFKIWSDAKNDMGNAARFSIDSESRYFAAMDAEEDAKHADRSESCRMDAEIGAQAEAAETNS